jgi:acetyl-CoA carboxylase alpha subunit
LWRDAAFAPQAAAALKLTATALVELGIVDGIIPEPAEGAHRDHAATAAAVKQAVLEHLGRLGRLTPEELIDRRFGKYSGMGKFVS